MVTVRAIFSALLIAASVSACRTTPALRKTALPKARPPKQAVLLAQKTADPSTAAELAWLEGNDRKLARTRLDQALKTQPNDPALLIRRAMLSLTELDDDAALDDFLKILARAPDSVEAEAAIAILSDSLGDHLDARERVAHAIADSHYTSDRKTRALRVLLAAHMQSRMDLLNKDQSGMKATVERGGFFTRFTAVGPLGPRTIGALVEPTAHEKTGIDPKALKPYRGLIPPVRELNAFRTSASMTAGDRAGLYVIESWFELGEDVRGVPLTLNIQLHDSGRVSIDGARVHESMRGTNKPKSYSEVELKLEPGWHRLSIAVLALSASRPTFSLLSSEGRAVIVRQSATPPRGPRAVPPPPAIAKRSSNAERPGSIEAWVDALIADKEHALFGSFMGNVLALTTYREDLERAERLLTLALEAAPSSALLLSTDARMMGRSGLPKSLAQVRLRESLKHDPTLPSTLLSLARSIAEDSPDAAMELLDRAIAANPRAAGPHVSRFRLLEQRGWNAEASRALTKALSLHQSESLLADGASFYRNTMRIEEARALEKQLERFTEPTPATARAQLALKNGELDAAIAAFKEAAQTTSVPSGTYVRIASIELSRGNIDAARLAAEDALKSDPLNTSALRIAALALARGGDSATASKTIDRLRALGAADVKMETFAATLRGGEPGIPPDGSWLAKKLAVDPRALVAASKDADLKWSRYKSVRLLERIVDYVRPDGSSLSLKHAITRLMTKEATDEAGEINLGNDALPLALRTIKSDGRIIETDRHAGKDDLSFSALAPGDAVEYQWVETAEAATGFGGYVRRYFFRGQQPGLRNEYAAIVAKGTPVWWRAYNGAPEPEIHDEGEQTIYLFRAQETPPIDPEPSTVPLEEFVPFVVLAVDLDQKTALASNVLGLETAAESSWAVRRKAAALTQKMTTDEQKLNALFNFTANQIGHGGAREPSIVLATRRGDRTGLLIAMLRSVGLGADLVLARPGTAAQVKPEYPSPQQFNVDLVRVVLPSSKKTLWARMDLPTPWLGGVTPDLYGGSYIVANPRGELPKVIAFAEKDFETWALTANVELAVDGEGQAKGSIALSVPGSYGSNFRTFFKSVREDEIARALEGFASGMMPGALVESWKTEGLDEPLAPLIVRLAVVVPHFMVVEKQHLIAEQFFPIPLAGRALGMPTLAMFLRVPNRTTPMYLPEIRESMSVRVSFPRSVKAPIEGPRAFSFKPSFGEVTQKFAWDDAKKTAALDVSHVVPPRRIGVKEFPKFRETVQQILQAGRNRLIVPLGADATITTTAL